VKEVTPSAKNMVLFDVCCGTGTIGLTCLKEGAVGKVVGVDISEPGTSSEF
jgi:tRNA (uracil-5-)-methyltransferase